MQFSFPRSGLAKPSGKDGLRKEKEKPLRFSFPGDCFSLSCT